MAPRNRSAAERRRASPTRTTRATKRARSTLPPGIEARLKGWLTIDEDFLLGPRYIQLLEGIDRTGTIREGCRATRMSYRTCLDRIRRMEAAIGAPLVITQRGGALKGSAALAPLARQLIQVYRSWRNEVEGVSRAAFARVLRAASNYSP